MTLTLKIDHKDIKVNEGEKEARGGLYSFYIYFPERWRLAQLPPALAATHAAQSVKQRMEPVRSLQQRASMIPLFERGALNPCLCARFWSRPSGEGDMSGPATMRGQQQ